MRYIRDQVCDAINIFLYLLVNYCYNGTDVKRKKLRVRKSENESGSESKRKRNGLSVNAKWGSIEEDHLQISRKFFEWHEKRREKKGKKFWLMAGIISSHFHPPFFDDKLFFVQVCKTSEKQTMWSEKFRHN